MSQSGVLTLITGGKPVVETLTGNSGGAVGPDGSFNLNLLGNNSSGINVVGNPGTNTLTITAYQATTSQEGTVILATDAQAIAGTDTANALTSSNLAAKLGTQTAHSLAVFEGSTSALTALGAAINGQLPIGSTGADPVLSTLTAGTGITITNGAGSISIAVSGSMVGETITGNSGGALSPTAGNWNILGASTAAGSSPVTSSGAGSTLTLNVQTSQAIAATDATKIGLAAFKSTDFNVDASGFVSVATGTSILKTLTGNSGGALAPTAGNINTLGTGSITIAGAGSTLTTQLTGLTNHALQIGAGTATLTQLGAGSTGQILQTNTTADPTWSTATFPSIATGTGTLLRADGTNWVATTSTYPNTNAVSTLLYASSTNVMSALATANNGLLVTSNTGVPSILAGPGTTGQIIQSNAAAAPSFSTASYPSTTTVSQILYSSSTNVVAGLATANRGVLTTNSTGVPVVTAIATDGQIIIGSTAGSPAAATISAGAGISVTNGSNSITITAIGAGFTWSDTSGVFTAAVENGYFITGTSTATMPAAPNEGDTIAFIVDTTQFLTITGNTGQKLRIGTALSGAAGTAVNNARGDSIEFVYRTTGTTWFSLGSPQGTWTVT